MAQMDRRIEPEFLDELSPANPAAVQSRRDLRRLNLLMGHVGILTRALRLATCCGSLAVTESRGMMPVSAFGRDLKGLSCPGFGLPDLRGD